MHAWHRNLCIPSNRCLSAVKFIGSSAISQSCRRVLGAAPCAPSSLSAAGLFRYSASPLDPFNRNSPIFPAPPTSCGIPLETFRYSYLPATTSKIPSSPRSARESSLSLSYKGFAATYNISSSLLFPYHFALSRHPPPLIYLLTLLIISFVLSLFLFLSLFRSSYISASHSLPVHCHRRLNSHLPSVLFSTYFTPHSSFTTILVILGIFSLI